MLPTPIDVPGERIYEFVTEADGRPYGIALVELMASQRHVHRETKEVYVLVEGTAEAHITRGERMGMLRVLRVPGDCAEISPNEPHWARSTNDQPAHVIVISTPPWQETDHHLVP